MPRSRSRSRSPKRDVRRGARSRSRSRERRRNKDRRRSRSRSPRRNRHRSISRSPSPRRYRRSQSPRRRLSRSNSPRRSRRSRSRSPYKKGPHRDSKSDDGKNEIDGIEMSLDPSKEDEDDMMKVMGFSNFDSTKGKYVEGCNQSATSLKKARKYRQYMNRKGGFNRPLDYVA
ncbi:U4/U6.U5 small nuclear ribonucleoprotein 27 kDa protein-like [Actinia tenebrosa]|uniref:U4/U6.U5 small nuclear ribonucleoprotein 27 kDa protein n=1 Tax=Actinia tenebrosa TaxID=6105 RepID=A0A6P8HKR2_ACTTE|nr:U4/U6.U5 small nuclear ribonucleoprotein 27 kDa protein-like [Actinia tenebrosa]